MTLPKPRSDREYQKFTELSGGEVAVNVILKDQTLEISGGNFNIDVSAFENPGGDPADALVDYSGNQYSYSLDSAASTINPAKEDGLIVSVNAAVNVISGESITSNVYLDDLKTGVEFVSGQIVTSNTKLEDIRIGASNISGATYADNSAVDTRVMVNAGRVISGVPVEHTSGASVTYWTDEYGRQINAGFNTSLDAVNVNEVSPALLQTNKETAITQLTTPGATSAKNIENYGIYGYTFTVANVSGNVIVKLQGSIDETNYATLPLEYPAVSGATLSGSKMIVSDNGTFGMFSTAPVVDVKFFWESEGDGSVATIDADFFARRR